MKLSIVVLTLKATFICYIRYFKIDGTACSDPGAIDAIGYYNKLANVHQPMTGQCSNSLTASHGAIIAVCSEHQQH